MSAKFRMLNAYINKLANIVKEMIMKYLLTFLLIISFKLLIAQTLYLDSIHSVVNKTTFDFKTYKSEILQFDFYAPENVEDPLPLVIVVHGGGFMFGSRDHGNIPSFATKLAQRGYAVASVSYRLTMKDIGYGCDIEASKKVAAIDSASYDVTMAVKYILENNNLFHINQDKIVIAGGSTGAYTVLHMAYVNDNKILPSDFRFAGVISMAGALTTLDKINNVTAIPTQLFHGTGDNLVPYDMGPHAYCRSNDIGYFMFYGSATIAKRLRGLGASYFLYTINGGSHSWSGRPMTRSFNDIVDFLYYDIINVDYTRQTERSIDENE
jgi:acetyl esterase/lipase